MKCTATIPEWLSEIKHVTWRVFGEIFKFRENISKNRFREIFLSVHKIPKSKYFAKVITYSKYPDHVLQSYI